LGGGALNRRLSFIRYKDSWQCVREMCVKVCCTVPYCEFSQSSLRFVSFRLFAGVSSLIFPLFFFRIWKIFVTFSVTNLKCARALNSFVSQRTQTVFRLHILHRCAKLQTSIILIFFMIRLLRNPYFLGGMGMGYGWIRSSS